MGIKGKGRKQPVRAMSIASTGLIKINVFFFFVLLLQPEHLFLQKEEN